MGEALPIRILVKVQDTAEGSLPIMSLTTTSHNKRIFYMPSILFPDVTTENQEGSDLHRIFKKFCMLVELFNSTLIIDKRPSFIPVSTIIVSSKR